MWDYGGCRAGRGSQRTNEDSGGKDKVVEGDDMCLNIENGLGQALWNSLLGHWLHDSTDLFDIYTLSVCPNYNIIAGGFRA